MKKTKFLSLVLITSALATCGNTKTAYKPEYKDADPDNIASTPKHWHYQPISEAELTRNMIYSKDSTHHGTGHGASNSAIERGGFGYSNPNIHSGS